MGVIEINNLIVQYNGINVLEDICLDISEGEFLGIIGPNGGGKTTLLKVILGLVKPDSGEVKINTRNIGYVPQFTAFDKRFPISVQDVVIMGRLVSKFGFFKKYHKEDLKVAYDTMDKLGIDQFHNRQIGKLSGGQLQKVLIARAIVNNPKILILDEPTSNIDPNTRVEIFEILKKLNNDMTILIVSHDVDDIILYVDSIACLNRKLHYHENKNKIDIEGFNEKYNCPVKYYLKTECSNESCTCGGNSNA